MKKIFFFIPVLFLLLSCDDHQKQEIVSNPDAAKTFTNLAIVATASGDYSSGAHSVISYTAPRQALNDLLPTISDVAITSYGQFFYRIERFNSNNVTKFDAANPDVPIWQFSTEDVTGAKQSNPYTMVFVSNDKAYLLRYGSNKLWVVKPSAITEADFKIGEIDLSAYDDGDGSPEMSSGVIVNGKLFLALQRLDMNNLGDTTNVSYIAVIDTNTDTEIDTGKGLDGLKGIALDIRNPSGKIRYFDNYIYAAGADNLFGGSNYGGIQKLNVNTYATEPLIMAAGKHITDLAIVSDSKGYYIGYQGWGDNVLRAFNPETMTGTDTNVAGIGNSADRSLFNIVVDKDGLLWVADGSITDSGIYIINTVNDTIQEGPISTNLNPIEITFCEI